MDQPNAIFMIGECYYLGNGVEKDLEKAAEWYEKALDAGYKPDEEDKARLKEVLGEEYGTTEETTSDDSDSSPDKVDIKDRKLTEEELAIAKHVIANFLKMEAVPRPSGHEEKRSASLSASLSALLRTGQRNRDLIRSRMKFLMWYLTSLLRKDMRIIPWWDFRHTWTWSVSERVRSMTLRMIRSK